MDTQTFAKSVYLGDRACKALHIDTWNRRVTIQIDTISRIRSTSGEWEYYTEEDIEDGLLVFDGVTFFSLSPPGCLPNDWISIVDVESVSEQDGVSLSNPQFRFTLSLGAVTEAGEGQELSLTLVAAGIHIEDPARPGITITD